MPRKAFIADIDAAANAGIPGMTGICRGEDDGDVSVCYATNTGLSVEISLLVTPGKHFDQLHASYVRGRLLIPCRCGLLSKREFVYDLHQNRGHS